MTRRRSSYSRAAARRRRELARRRRLWRRISTIAVLSFAAVGIFLSIVTYHPSAPTTPALLPRDISVQEAYARYQQGALVLDVRSAEEWQSGHIPGAVSVPLNELSDRLTELPRGVPILVICASGGRSPLGRDLLLSAGFENVASVNGGMSAWIAQGYPLISP